MTFGLKAYSSVNTDALVLDDTFSTWVISQSGVTETQAASLQRVNYPAFNALTSPTPQAFVQIPSTGTWGFVGGFDSTTGQVTNMNALGITQYEIFNTGNMNYRIYFPANLQLNPQTVKTGYGLNIFDSTGKATFASSVKPLLFDYVGTLNSGLSSLDNATAGYYGTEINLGINQPFVYALTARIESVTPVGANQRLVRTLFPVYYHSSGTCRVRFYLYGRIIAIAVPSYGMQAPNGSTFQQSILALSA